VSILLKIACFQGNETSDDAQEQDGIGIKRTQPLLAMLSVLVSAFPHFVGTPIAPMLRIGSGDLCRFVRSRTTFSVFVVFLKSQPQATVLTICHLGMEDIAMRYLLVMIIALAVSLAGSITKAAGPDQAKPDQAKPDQAKPDQAKPDQAKPDQAKPDQVKPDQTKTAKPDQVKAEKHVKVAKLKKHGKLSTKG
jgi:hypothetical protein